jgi:hypothetical protein
MCPQCIRSKTEWPPDKPADFTADCRDHLVVGHLSADSLLLPTGRIYLGAGKFDPVNNPPTVSPPTSSLDRETALVRKSPNHQAVQALSSYATRGS